MIELTREPCGEGAFLFRCMGPTSGSALMAIAVPCPGCGRNLKVKDELAGKRIRCPDCGQVLLVPAGELASRSRPGPNPTVDFSPATDPLRTTDPVPGTGTHEANDTADFAGASPPADGGTVDHVPGPDTGPKGDHPEPGAAAVTVAG